MDRQQELILAAVPGVLLAMADVLAKHAVPERLAPPSTPARESGYRCKGCGYVDPDPIPTVYNERNQCRQCASTPAREGERQEYERKIWQDAPEPPADVPILDCTTFQWKKAWAAGFNCALHSAPPPPTRSPACSTGSSATPAGFTTETAKSSSTSSSAAPGAAAATAGSDSPADSGGVPRAEEVACRACKGGWNGTRDNITNEIRAYAARMLAEVERRCNAILTTGEFAYVERILADLRKQVLA